MRVAISGLGTIWTRHLETLSAIDGVEVVAAADPALAGGNNTTIPSYRSFEAMLDDTDTDAVVLCTPSWLHAEQGAYAADRGIHVISEKPLATTLPQADTVIEACRRNGVRLAVLHQYRFHAPLIALKQAIDRGDLGRLAFVNVAFHWRRDRSYYEKDGGWRGTWRGDGGGALMNQGAHAVDLVRWLGGPIETVAACSTNVQHAIEAEDTISVVLRFRNGGLGTIQVTTCASRNHPAVVQVQGTEGSATSTGAGLSFNGGDFITTECGAPHRAQFVEIFRAIEDGLAPPVEGDDARQTLADTIAMYESAHTGAAVTCRAAAVTAD